VVAVTRPQPGLTQVTVQFDGDIHPCAAYDALTGPVEPGDRVLVNTTAMDLGLGTGGVHFVMAIEGRDLPGPPGGHAMKLRYSPVQLSVDAVEDEHGPALDAASLAGVPIVIAPLHSLLAPITLGVRAQDPALRVGYVMSDGGALPIAFSRTVAALSGTGLLAATVTAGHAFGGDLEAINVTSAMVAARAVARADVVVVAMGPGSIGTASRLGFAGLEAGAHVNAAASLGARPIVVPRISFADPRERHRGLSHHTVTALSVAALARAEIVLPAMTDEQRTTVEHGLDALRSRHDVVIIPDDVDGLLASSPVPLRSMGRSPSDDPVFFRAGAAAGMHAARIARS
jgi:hypothetical protein